MTRVLLGVSGGIAAYKAPAVVRRLRERGCEVRCALTPAGAAFVTPLSLEVVSGHRVYDESYLRPGSGGEEEHIAAADWADVLLVAPATADLLASLALGLGRDFVTTTALAFDGELVVAPAMHPSMWRHQATTAHVETLRRRGIRFIDPVDGPLASGETGIGRMAEPEVIAAEIAGERALPSWGGWRVLVTAGPTHEPIDPVRFIGNRSSGKMGFAIAAAARRRGAEVTLVAGPVALATPAGVDRVDVETAREMEEVTRELAAGADLVVMAAAVGDFRPIREASEKLKRRDGAPTIELEENPDILAALGASETNAVLVGFAAETGVSVSEEEARRKLDDKRVDFLVVNDVSRPDIGFESDHNEATVHRRGGESIHLSRRPKRQLAEDLLDLFAEALDRPEDD